MFSDIFATTILAPHPESSVIIDTLADGQFVFVEVMGKVVEDVEEDLSDFEFNRARFRTMLGRVVDDFRDNPFWAAAGG